MFPIPVKRSKLIRTLIFLICEIVTFSVEQFRVEKFEQKCHWFGSENLKTFGFPMLYLKFYNVSFNVCRS